MKQKFFSFLLTALLGVFGMNAWAQDYEISSAQDLADFAEAVNGGETTASAVLTADIDMSTLSSWTAIGDWNTGAVTSAYCGHFDGQGHTIYNFNFTSTHNYYGIFGVVSTGCLIENFTIYGTLNLGHKTGGVVGYSRDATPTIRNVHSYLTINVTEAATTALRPGGILGSAVNGTTVIENCSYSGTLNVGEHTGNIGGIVGYVNNNTAAIVNITNCLFDGKILNGTTADGQCGGIVGYNNAGKVTIKNCLSIGTIEAKSNDIGMFFGRLNGTNSIFDNNYYVGDYINGTGSGKSASGPAPVKVTKTQLRNGETCYKLNGDQSTINWFQELKNMAFIAEKYVTTVDGADRAEQNADIKLVENDEGTFDFTLPNFVVSTNYFTFPVGDISLQDITITSAGTFSKGGTFSVPDENIPSQLITMGVSTDKFKDVPYTLNGKVNGEKLYATINDITFDLGMLGGERHVSVEVGTDDFEAKAPTGDDYPTPYGTDIVYANGTFNCDLTPKEGTEVTYSNTEASFIAAHIFADGFCTYCGAFDASYMTANADGNFEIGTPAQLKWFAIYVNQVNPAVNAILTANIDLSSIEWTPIGKGVYYGGTFDGQGFTVSNLTYVGSGDCNGLFGGVKDATVKNFSINGSLVCAGSWTGAIGRAENATISNVHSALTIETPATGVFHHAGGVVGGSYNPTTVDRCSFSGTLTVNAESHDCFGGIMGYTTEYCTVKNCINYGTISFAKDNCYAGGIIGYINSATCNGTHNCLNIGTVEYTGEGDPSYSGAIVGRLRGNNPALWGYSYYLAGSAVNANGENQIPTNYEVTSAQLANGEAAAKLAPYIRQNISTDATPVLDPTHNVVAEITAAGYATLYVPDTDVKVPTGVTAYTGEFATNPNNGIQHLALNEVGSIIPAQTAVVLKGAEGIYEFAISTPVPDGALGVYNDEVDGNEALVKGWAAPIADNVLKGTADDIEAAGKYILAQPAGEPVCFYLAESGIIKAGKAYLEVPAGTDVKAFYFSFGDEDPTGISTIDNAQLTIDSKIYNLAGQRVSKMQKGINIVNGKKILK